jgi:hypothetical protein
MDAGNTVSVLRPRLEPDQRVVAIRNRLRSPLGGRAASWEAAANRRRPTRVTPALPSASPGPTVSRGSRLIDARINRPHTWCATADVARGAGLINPRIDDTASRRADTRCAHCTGHATRRDAGGGAIDDRGHTPRRDAGGGAWDLRMRDGRNCGQADRSEKSKVTMCHCECPSKEDTAKRRRSGRFKSNFGPSLTPPISVLAPPAAVGAPPRVLAPPAAVPAPPRVLALAPPPRSALARVPARVRAERTPSRPQPRRRMPPRGRAGHGLRTPASRIDTVCLRSIPGEERRLFLQSCRSVS